MQLEELIFSNLLSSERYTRHILPHLKEEYFKYNEHKLLFGCINDYFLKYNSVPTKEVIQVEIEEKQIQQDQLEDLRELVESITTNDEENEYDWLVDNTEKFCQDMALNNALSESIAIYNGDSDSKLDKGAIPDILKEAMGVSFDNSVGHDYLNEYEERFKEYSKKESKIPFDIEVLNKITNGGCPSKTLNIILAGTNVGKTLIKCHLMAMYLMYGYDVLYISAEMSETEISRRADANILNVDINEIEHMPEALYIQKFKKKLGKVTGRLIVKEFPTASAHAGHIKHLLTELEMKQDFKPKIIFADYLGIFLSSRYKLGGGINTNTYLKSVAEEFRGIAVENDLVFWTSTQTNRTGYTSTDVGLEDTADSFGLTNVADFMIAAMSDETLEEMGCYVIKQLKNRYNKKSKDRKSLIGVDYDKMRIFDHDGTYDSDDNNDKTGKDTRPTTQSKKRSKDTSGLKI